MMRGWSRVLLALAALGLVTTYFAPLWHIALKAPQYPEGLGMYIWSSRITGELRSINGLNHYIGMKEIHPEAIPELRLMPQIVAGLVALGLVAAAFGRRVGLYAWTALFGGGALIGLVDFWRWGYDYGHHLDPEAALALLSTLSAESLALNLGLSSSLRSSLPSSLAPSSSASVSVSAVQLAVVTVVWLMVGATAVLYNTSHSHSRIVP